MLNNVAIDVAIGLIFIILLYSLLATIIQEMVARWLGLRARTLFKGIRRMLEDDRDVKDLIGNWPLPLKKFIEATTLGGFFLTQVRGIQRFFHPFRTRGLAYKFYKHPSIKYLGENRWTSKPSYITSSNFSSTLIQLLRGEDYDGSVSQMDLIRNTLKTNRLKIEPDTLRYLKALLADSDNDLEKFRNNLEKWFDEVMERATGWYKRKAQLYLFLIGLTIAAIFNVDSIRITKILATNDGARRDMVNMAIQTAPVYEKMMAGMDSSDPAHKKAVLSYMDSSLINAYKVVDRDIKQSQNILGLGRQQSIVCDGDCKTRLDSLLVRFMHKKITHAQLADSLKTTIRWSGFFEGTEASNIPGWILTALAISLGAPFWFDLLNKLMKLRGTGRRPEGSSAAKAEGERNTAATVPAEKRVG